MKFIVHEPDHYLFSPIYFGRAMQRLKEIRSETGSWEDIGTCGAFEYGDLYEVSWKRNKSSISLWGRFLTRTS